MVDDQPCAVGDRRQLLQHDVEAIRGRVGARLDEDVAAHDLPPLDPRQRHRDALARLGSVDRAIVDLDAAHPRRDARGLESQLVALSDAARPQRAGRDGADAAQGEGPVDRQTRRQLRAARHDRRRGPGEGRAQVVQPGPREGADRDHLGARDELTGLLDGELDRLRVDAVGLGHRDDAALHAQQTQDREVLVRLGARPLGRVDHEQEEVDAGGTGDHRPDEALVPRHVDERQALPAGQLERGVAEVDRDPPPLLLG